MGLGVETLSEVNKIWFRIPGGVTLNEINKTRFREDLGKCLNVKRSKLKSNY